MRSRCHLALLGVLVCVLAIGPGRAVAAGPNAVQNLPGCTEHEFPGNDDGSVANVALPFTLDFFGNEYSTVNLNNNGNLTFDNPVSKFTPYDFTVTGEPVIAPLLADVDTRVGSVVTYGTATVNGHTAFCVNWVDVGYFADHVDKTNSFQLLLIDEGPNPGDFVIRMNYDRIAWETGDASNGQGGFGGVSAAAGLSSGDGDPDHFFVFAGSFVNGALLDGGPDALVAGTLDAGGQLGRYDFAVVNAPPTGATLTGLVHAPGGAALGDAPVEICRLPSGPCIARFSNSLGRYRALNLPAGEYEVIGRAPASGPAYGQATAGPVTVSGLSTFTQDVTLAPAPGAPPPGTEITHIGESEDGVPTAYWQEPLTLSTEGCVGATVSYEVVVEGQVVRSGTLAASPPGSGFYSGVVPALYPIHGDAQVSITIDCPSSPDSTIDFGLYIDPSGRVVNAATGAPIAGAEVVLLRSSDPAGPFTQVPSGSAVMSAANRSNPDVTDASGAFGWDVIAGYYKVLATAAGCQQAETAVLSIPPPVTDLRLGLTCGTASVPPGPPAARPAASAAPPPPAEMKKKRHHRKKHKRCRKHAKKKCGHRKHHARPRFGASPADLRPLEVGDGPLLIPAGEAKRG